jgi:hypothetical protein
MFGRKKLNRQAESNNPDTSVESQVEAPTLDYSNPTLYKRVVDDRNHVHQHIIEHPSGGLCIFRGNWNGPIKAYKQRCSLVPRVKQFIDEAGWQRFFLIDTEKSSMRFVEALVERWWDTTHTFHLPCGELGFTPLDWAMLTGISIGVGTPLPYSDDEYNFDIVKARFFPEITSSDWKSQGIRCSFLKKYFQSSMLEAAMSDDTIAERIARAFFLFFLGEFLFPNGSSVVSIGWLAALEDLGRVSTYDWGSPAVAVMYLSLDQCSRQNVKSFNGPWQVLEVKFQYECIIYLNYIASLYGIQTDFTLHFQYWAFDYMHICVPLSKKMDIADVLAAADVRPKIARWNRDQLDMSRSDHIRFNISTARNQLEMRTASSIIWEPYMGSSFHDEHDIQVATKLSRHRVILEYRQQVRVHYINFFKFISSIILLNHVFICM